MKVAVAVLNYNSSADTRKCLDFLVRQEGVELDIIVVDNCSSSEERTLLEHILNEYKGKCAPHIITYIPNDENRGYNAGNNIALRYAAKQGYEYAMISNPDMEFPQLDYIAMMLTKMKNDNNIVVEGSNIINNEGLHQNPSRELAFVEEFLWPFEYIKNIKSKKWYSLSHDQSCYCEKLSGCCLLLRLSFVTQIGFFDENVFLYSEESILGAQVRLSSGFMFYNHECSAIHRHIEKNKGKSKPRMKALFKSRWYYLNHYSGYSRFSLSLLWLSKQFQKLITIGI